MKIRPLGAKLFHADAWADRQTDMTKLIVTFHNFANVPKNGTHDILVFIYSVLEM
jgi:hypothetical protein